MLKSKPRPVSAATRALLDEMRDDAKPSDDKLTAARTELAKLRDYENEVVELEARVKAAKAAAYEIKNKTLVDMLDEIGLNGLSLAAEGNLPAFEVTLDDYYKANIPEEHRSEAFDYLRKTGHADLVKTTFTVAFGLKESKAAERFQRSLEKADIQYSATHGVPWNTLTAWFKSEHKKKPLTVKAMGLLGATVGRVVNVVKQKDKR